MYLADAFEVFKTYCDAKLFNLQGDLQDKQWSVSKSFEADETITFKSESNWM